VRRSLIVILSVAALSGWIGRCERAAGIAARSGSDWLRTVDGWEHRRTIEASGPAAPLELHPATVAAFQLVASLLVLVAFPERVKPAPLRCVAAPGFVERRRAPRPALVSR
jgi:hypothetical protein